MSHPCLGGGGVHGSRSVGFQQGSRLLSRKCRPKLNRDKKYDNATRILTGRKGGFGLVSNSSERKAERKTETIETPAATRDDNPTCDNIDKSEVLEPYQTKHQEKRGSDERTAREDERGDETNAFLMQCTSPVQPKTENKKRGSANGYDRIRDNVEGGRVDNM